MIRFLVGDCRETLKGLPEKSVQCVVTSPPYFGLRDYGTAVWVGGDPECDHVVGTLRSLAPSSKSTLKGNGHTGGGPKLHDLGTLTSGRHDECPRCDARRDDPQIGREATPEAYIAEMVEVFRLVWRVLRDDGVLFLNIGDSYANGGGIGNKGTRGTQPRHAAGGGFVRPNSVGLAKSKDLLGIPWMLAFALRADGWYLRQDIIWHKPNPMPESTRDRCTKAHEYLFLLTKRPTYYFDHEAMKEPVSGTAHSRGSGVNPKALANGFKTKQNTSFSAAVSGLVSMRNRRSVWTVSSRPFQGAHFATFPPDLIEPCVLAGTSAHGRCAACGAPFERQVEAGEADLEHQRACGGAAIDGSYDGQATKDYAAAGAQNPSDVKRRILLGLRAKVTTGWNPTCDCPPQEPMPCVVLDPFGGAGTTGLVAQRHGRDAVLCELNEDYVDIARLRLGIDLPIERAMLRLERAVSAAITTREEFA